MPKIRVKYLLHGEFVQEVDEEFMKLSPEDQLEKAQELLQSKTSENFMKTIVNDECKFLGGFSAVVEVPIMSVKELQIDTKVSFVGIEKEDDWLEGNQKPLVVREDWDAYWCNGFSSPIIYPSQE